MKITLTVDQETELVRRAGHMSVTPEELAEAYIRGRLRKPDTPGVTGVSGKAMLQYEWPPDDWWSE